MACRRSCLHGSRADLMGLLLASWARTIAGPVARTVPSVLASASNAKNAGLKSATIGWIAAGVVIAIGMMMARVIASQVASSMRIVATATTEMVHVAGLIVMIVTGVTGCEAAMIANQVDRAAARVMGVVQIAMNALQCVAIAAGTVK